MRSTFKRVVAGVLSVSMAISNLSVPGLSFAAAADEAGGSSSSPLTAGVEHSKETKIIIVHHHAGGDNTPGSDKPGSVEPAPNKDENGKEVEILNGYTISAGQRAVSGDIKVKKTAEGGVSMTDGKKVDYEGNLLVSAMDNVPLVKIDLYYRALPDTSNSGKDFTAEVDGEGEIKTPVLLGDGTDVYYDEKNDKLIYDTSEGLHTEQRITVDGEEENTREFELTLESWYAGNNSTADIGMVLDASGSMAFTYNAPSFVYALNTPNAKIDQSYYDNNSNDLVLNRAEVVKSGFKIGDSDDNFKMRLYVEYQPLLAYMFSQSEDAKAYPLNGWKVDGVEIDKVDLSAPKGYITEQLYQNIVDHCQKYDTASATDYFATEPEEKDGKMCRKFLPEKLKLFYMGEDDKPYLTQDGVNMILNPNKTDNSRLGYADYSYFVYDPRSSTREFVPLGYWDGNNNMSDPIDKEALSNDYIAHYNFNGTLENTKTHKMATAIKQAEKGTGESITFDTEPVPSREYTVPFAFKNGKSGDIDNSTIDLSKMLESGVVELDASPKLGENGFSIAMRIRIVEEANDGDNRIPLLLITNGKSGKEEKYVELVRMGKEKKSDGSGYDDKSHTLRVYNAHKKDDDKNYGDFGGAVIQKEKITDSSGKKEDNPDKCSWVNLVIVFKPDGTIYLDNTQNASQTGELVLCDSVKWDSDESLQLVLGGSRKGYGLGKSPLAHTEITDMVVIDKAIENGDISWINKNNGEQNIKQPNKVTGQNFTYNDVIGWYTFDEATTEMDNGSGETVNVKTFKNKKEPESKDSYAKYVTEPGSTELVEISNGKVQFSNDNKWLDLSGTAANDLGILLDQKPTVEGGYTVSFKMKTSHKTSSKETLKGDANIMYFGPTDGEGSNYYEIDRYAHDEKVGSKDDARHLRVKNSNGKNTKIDNVFQDTDEKVITVVVDGSGKLDIYSLYKKDEKVTKTSANVEADTLTDPVNIILAGLKYSGQEDAKILIDELYVFDSALEGDQLDSLWHYKYKLPMESMNPPDSGEKRAIYDKDDNVMGFYNYGKLSNTTRKERAGWYYVSSSGNIDVFEHGTGETNGFNTSKLYNGLENEFDVDSIADVKSYLSSHSVDGISVTEDNRIKITAVCDFSGFGTKDTDGALYDPKEFDSMEWGEDPTRYVTFGDGDKDDAGGVRFFIDNSGNLRCFFNTGNATKKDGDGLSRTTFCSLVYEKRDDETIKTEELQSAIAEFSAKVAETSPDSMLSAVRFSSDDYYTTKYKDKVYQLLLLDWTNDPEAVTAMLNQKNGADAGVEVNVDSNNENEYNYYLTGDTATGTGVEYFKDKLSASDKVAHKEITDDKKKPDKYLIIFTDGNDTTDDGQKKNTSDFKKDETNFYKDRALNAAKELKEKGYTIFCVLLASDGVDVPKATSFLATLAGDKTTLESEGGDSSKVFVFSTEDEDTHGNKLTLTQLFEQKIFRKIFADLDDYAVQNYIDPRFNIKTVTENGEGYKLSTVELGDNGTISVDGTLISGLGKISIGENDSNQSVPNNPGNVYELNLNYDLVDNPDVASEASDKAYLCFDSGVKQYYITWLAQKIPSAQINAEKLAVWRSTVKLVAKDDFIGGNAVLAGGNATGQNFVYYPHEPSKVTTTNGKYVDFGSRTNKNKDGNDDSKLVIDRDESTGRIKRDENGNLTILNYPSKGFPRTAADVKEYDLSNVNISSIKYLGESRDELYTIIKNLADGSVECVGDSKYFWDYLRRFAEFYPNKDDIVVVEADNSRGIEEQKAAGKDFKALVDILAGKQSNGKYSKNGGTLKLPYSYISPTSDSPYSKPLNGQPGSDAHQKDVIGEITYKFTLNETSDSNVYGNNSDPTDQVLVVLDGNEYTLSVSYQPYDTPEKSEAEAAEIAETSGEKERKLGELITDSDFKMNFGETADDTKTLRQYSRLAGTKQEKIDPKGVYSILPVSGAIIMQMKIAKDDVEFLQTYAPKTDGKQNVKFTADLYKDPLPVSGPVYLTTAADTTSTTAGVKIGTYEYELDISTLTTDITLSDNDDGIEYNAKDEYYYIPVKFKAETTTTDKFEPNKYGFPLGAYYLKNITLTPTGFNGITESTATLDLSDDPYMTTDFESITWNVDEANTAENNDGTLKYIDGSTKKVEITDKDGNTYGQYYRYALQAMHEKQFEKHYTAKKDDPKPEKPVSAPNGIQEADYGKYAVHHQDKYDGSEETPTWYLGLSYDGVDYTDALLGAGEATLDVNHVEFDIVKELVGRTWQDDDEFKFDIKLVNGSAENAFVNGKKAKEDGTFEDSIVIDKDSVVTVDEKEVHKKTVGLSFTADDTYEFVVTEQENDDYTVEKNELRVIVNVVGGKIQTPIVDGTTTSSAMTFKNTYKSYVDWTPKVSKVLDGRNFIEGDEFTFTITSTDEDHIKNSDFEEAPAAVAIAADNGIAAISNGISWSSEKTIVIDASTAGKNSSTTTFPTIRFHKAGTYNFTVSEDNGSDDDIEYSTEQYNVKVVVAAEEGTGNLYIEEVTVNKNGVEEKYSDSDSIAGIIFEFTNVFSDEVEWTPKVTKEFDENGKIYLTDEKFTFTLTEYKDNTFGEVKDDIVKTIDVDSSSLTKSFETIKYGDDEEGKHYYTLQETDIETSDSKDKWKMDETVYYIEVNVYNNDDGILEKTVNVYTNKELTEKFEITEEKGYVFKNTFTPDPVTLAPQVKKFVKASNGIIPDEYTGKYTFELECT